jgi:hypothetical protein
MHTELKNYRLTGCDEWSRRYYFTAGMGRILLISGNYVPIMDILEWNWMKQE